ncbi:MAG TPA: hypothetical protein PK762_14245 [Candidatus Kapabacteria bacterium]|nr:hypothetical protein [Candidatus Kapabacteria bacterium]
MITYTREEIIPTTTLARNISAVLNKLKNKKLEKVAVIRNNNIEAVILPISIYEEMQKVIDLQEHKEIFEIVKERERISDKMISMEEILKEYNFNSNEL